MGVLKHRSRKWEIKNKIQVEAYQLGSNGRQPSWFQGYIKNRTIKLADNGAYIRNSGRLEFVPLGDYLINDKHNGLYSCSVNQFNDVFEEVE